MRLIVTPLGASGASGAGVAAAIVNYLEGRRGDPTAGLLGGVERATAYYADSVEGPGRWLGAGARFQSLVGRVDRDSFQRVLEGRHPRTGARLVTARGSSQREHLATGTAARYDASGDPLYAMADVARLLDLSREDVEALIAASSGDDDDDLGWMDTVDTPAGPMVPDGEVTRHLEVRARPVDPDAVRASGDPDELLSVRQVALLLHVSPRYVRRLCASHRDESTRRRRRASLPSVLVGDGPHAHYRVRRGDVAAFAESRRPGRLRPDVDL